MGRPPKNSGAKATLQVVDEVDKNINVNLEATVDAEKERLKAAELLGKRYALFTDKVETDVDMDLNITIDYGEDDTG